MPPTPLTVLVLAVGGNVSQGILKAIARAGRNYRVLGADISAPQMGLYTVDHALVSPWANQAAFLPWLLAVCKREAVHGVLSGCEPVLMALAEHRERIQEETGAICIVSDLQTMETGDDKLKTSAWLADQGFRHPLFASASSPEDVQLLVQQAGFPLIAKPRRGGGAHGHYRVEGRADLAYVCGKPDYLLQANIGTPDEEYTVGCFADRDGRLANSCCMRRDLLAGTTYRATLGDFPEVRAEAERIVSMLKPRGPCNVQMRLTDDGPSCFEINPRISGATPIRAHFGYNEVAAAIDHFVLGMPVDLPRIASGVALRYWNELYVDPGAVNALASKGELADPAQYAELETWGLSPRQIQDGKEGR